MLGEFADSFEPTDKQRGLAFFIVLCVVDGFAIIYLMILSPMWWWLR
jgi:hypothetical protein